MTEPMTDEQYDAIRGRAEGRYASTDVLRDAIVDRAALLAEVARLRAEVAELEEDSRMLRALEAAGVDNWDGYSEAFEGLED